MKAAITKFSLIPKELNSWKAKIAERLIESYVEQVLIPKVKREEGWDIVIFSRITWFSVPSSTGFNPDFRNERLFFLSNGLVPTPKLLDKFEHLTQTLENMPDGFLVKLRRTGELKSLGNSINEMGLKAVSRWKMQSAKSVFLSGLDRVRGLENIKKHGYAIVKGINFDREILDTKQELTVVDGDIEVIEVKADKGNLSSGQVRSYTKVVKNGFPLRFFKVDMLAFEKNQFEITERLIREPSEIKTRIDLG